MSRIVPRAALSLLASQTHMPLRAQTSAQSLMLVSCSDYVLNQNITVLALV